jgi:hypothetical protein
MKTSNQEVEPFKKSTLDQQRSTHMTPITLAVVTSTLSLIVALFAAIFSFVSQKKLKLIEAESRQQAESAEFLAAKLDKFYLPVSMHLSTTQKLFARFSDADQAEKMAIEEELRAHNTKVRELLMGASMYLEPDAPEATLKALLEHLIQWDIVYKLKYEYKVYDGPVFAGIKKFGFRGFPRKERDEDEGIDQYFDRKVRELRSKHHGRLALRA